MALQVNLIQSQKLHSTQTRDHHRHLYPNLREEEEERLESVFQRVFGNPKRWTLGAQTCHAVVTQKAGAIAAVVLARTLSHHLHQRQSLNPKLGTQLHRQRQQ